MAKWHKYDAGRAVPEPLRQAASTVKEINDTLETVFGTIKEALEIARLLASNLANNPVEAALREALEQIQQYIDDLIGGTTAHAIMIPIQKQHYGIGEPIPADATDRLSLTPSFDQLAQDGSYSQRVIKDITPETISFINTSVTSLGGNRGYWRALVLSLYDEGDFARPDFPNNFAVTGACVIFGSKQLADLYKIIALLTKWIRLGFRADMGARSQPIPSTLKATTIPIPTEGRIGVQLDWTPIPPVITKALFSSERMFVREIFIVRSTDPLLRERFGWGQVFTEEPEASGLPVSADGRTRVIARLPNDGLIARYVDKDTSLKVDTSYYYALALRYGIGSDIKTLLIQPMTEFSNVVWVHYMARPNTTRLSEPPDWFATPSLIQLFPIIQSFVNIIKLYVNGAINRTLSNNGIVALITQTINQIESLIAQAAEVKKDLDALEQILRSLSGLDGLGIYATTFDVTTGGMQAWVGKLAQQFSDSTDTSRPPFDRGDEFTAGFVIVAGAPRLPDLAKIRALLKLLFGDGSDEETIKLRTALDVFTDPEGPSKFTFDNQMQATRVSDDAAGEGKPVVFDETMTPAERDANC
jgi:hypothetical protein